MYPIQNACVCIHTLNNSNSMWNRWEGTYTAWMGFWGALAAQKSYIFIAILRNANSRNWVTWIRNELTLKQTLYIEFCERTKRKSTIEFLCLQFRGSLIILLTHHLGGLVSIWKQHGIWSEENKIQSWGFGKERSLLCSPMLHFIWSKIQ